MIRYPRPDLGPPARPRARCGRRRARRGARRDRHRLGRAAARGLRVARRSRSSPRATTWWCSTIPTSARPSPAACLVPARRPFSSDDLARGPATTIGPEPGELRYDGGTGRCRSTPRRRCWRCAADLRGARPRPGTRCVALAARVPVALSLAGPHAVLTFCSPRGRARRAARRSDRRRARARPATASQELGLLATCCAPRCRRRSALNPIELLDALAAGDDAALCARWSTAT